MESYKLRATLLGHSMDVRGVASGVTSEGKEFVVSSSRDKTSKIWIPTGDGSFRVHQTCEGHTNFVICTAVVPPCAEYPEGLILTGGNDHTILGFQIGIHSPIFRLAGHSNTVCSIAVTSGTELLFVSGSWDNSAKVWRGQSNIANLVGHSRAVWAVTAIPGSDHLILTGSADCEIRLWKKQSTERVFKGHKDCVRGLAILGEDRFISCSNDATILMWQMATGEVLHSFFGHSNFIYNLAALPDGGFASVGEDRTLRIWKDQETPPQVVFLPAISVWSVSAMANGDIVTGSSDGVVRIFTRESTRMASIEEQKEFEESVAQTTIAAQQELGGMKITELPGAEALLRPGKKDGDTKMVREGAKVVCYSWSQDQARWVKVGDVVGGSGATQNTSGRVLHEGKEYDYVFSVELDESKAPLKLPYNISEDPWFAAQKFLEKNDLDQLFLDQVANFIITNTKGMELGTTPSEYADPFTGGNRYVPGGPTSTAGGGVDPFTGSSAYRTGSAAPAPTPMEISQPDFPISEFLKFTAQPNIPAISSKLTDFLKAVGPDFVGNAEYVEDLARLAAPGTEMNEKLETTLRVCLEKFPPEHLFPLLDLLRAGVSNPSVRNSLLLKFQFFEKMVLPFVGSKIAANQMLALRLLCNLFGSATEALMEQRSAIIPKLFNHLQKLKTNQVAAATLLLNYSVVASGQSVSEQGDEHPDWVDTESQTEVLMAAVTLIDMLDEEEGIYRTLVAIGNLISGNEMARELFSSLGGASIAERYKSNGPLPKIKNCAGLLLSSIQN